jgi:hypothetical protein
LSLGEYSCSAIGKQHKVEQSVKSNRSLSYEEDSLDSWLIFAYGEPLQADGFDQFTRSVKNPTQDLRDIVKVLGNGKTIQ